MTVIVLTVATLVIAAVGVFVALPHVQRRLHLDVRPPPQPYQLPGTNITLLRLDPVVGAAVVAAEARGAKLLICHRHEIGEYRIRQGYVPFLTPDGAECQYARPGETVVLLVKESGS